MIRDFRNRLNTVRRFGNLTVTDLAQWFGVDRTSLHQWEKGVPPAFHREQMLEDRLNKLESLFKDGSLPIPLEIPRKDHHQFIVDLKNHAYAPVAKQNLTSKRGKAVVGH